MTDSTFWKKISPAAEINDLAGEAEPKSARIKPGSPADITAAQFELAEWLDRQPSHVRSIGASVLGELSSAQIGVRPHPTIIALLKEDVARLAYAAGKSI